MLWLQSECELDYTQRIFSTCARGDPISLSALGGGFVDINGFCFG